MPNHMILQDFLEYSKSRVNNQAQESWNRVALLVGWVQSAYKLPGAQIQVNSELAPIDLTMSRPYRLWLDMSLNRHNWLK